MPFQIPRPQANRLATQADIVFCVDATASMTPCINGVRDGLINLVNGLQASADVDYRLRLLAYRDIHPKGCNTPWEDHAFTSDEVFKSQVAAVTAQGGGDEPESTLDAIYRAIHSDWRTSQTHKTIVVLTDADTHPHLHKSTYNRPDNDVGRVIQDFQTLRHAMLFLVAPRCPCYEALEQGAVDADHKVIANWVPHTDLRHSGLSSIDWGPLMMMIGQVVSATSVVVAQEHSPMVATQ